MSQLDKFVAHCQEVINKHYKEQYVGMEIPTLSVNVGKKWSKIIVTRHASPAVYGFVCMNDGLTKTLGQLKNGDIHKAASFALPAKHARGSIFNEQTWNCSTPYGIVYLK